MCLRGAGCGASKPSEAGEKAPAPSSAPPKLEEPAKPKPAPEEPAKPKPAPEEPTKPAAEEPKPVPALAPAAAPDVPAAKWWEAELPDVVVVRKEVRKMPRAEQERVAAAVNKMRENDGGKKGSSQFFRLAAIHGGLPPLDPGEFPEYCVHGREAFPNWHRPYLLDFERTMRRADLALGGDGSIGLPYWDWSEAEVDGQARPPASSLISRDRPRPLISPRAPRDAATGAAGHRARAHDARV